jgi:hypothetical protein
MAGLFHSSDDVPGQVERLLNEARVHFAQRNPRLAAAKLHEAQGVAVHGGLFREASVLKRAMAILAGRGRPKLLARQTPLREAAEDAAETRQDG